MTIDDLLHGLHRDKSLTIEEQLLALEREIAARRLVSAEHTVRLFAQITELSEQILRLRPEHENAFDVHQRSREPLERERRQLERELVEELRSRWRDMQELKREQRTAVKEHTDELLRYDRHTTPYE